MLTVLTLLIRRKNPVIADFTEAKRSRQDAKNKCCTLLVTRIFYTEILSDGTIVWDNGTAVSLDSGTILSVDSTDKITSYGEEYSIAIRALETTDKVTFFSKEKRSIDKGGGYSHKKSVWPNLTFNQ